MVKRRVLSTDQRFKINLEIGKHLMLLGNLATGALVFGQAISGAQYDPRVAVVGITILIILYLFAVYSMKGGGK